LLADLTSPATAIIAASVVLVALGAMFTAAPSEKPVL
jgi:hypothetical protein